MRSLCGGVVRGGLCRPRGVVVRRFGGLCGACAGSLASSPPCDTDPLKSCFGEGNWYFFITFRPRTDFTWNSLHRIIQLYKCMLGRWSPCYFPQHLLLLSVFASILWAEFHVIGKAFSWNLPDWVIQSICCRWENAVPQFYSTFDVCSSF